MPEHTEVNPVYFDSLAQYRFDTNARTFPLLICDLTARHHISSCSSFLEQLCNPLACKGVVCSRKSSKRWLKSICRSQEGFFCEAEAPTWTESVEDLCHFRNVCKSFCINMPPLSQLFRVIAGKLKWRVAAQCAPPVIQQDRECELPLLNLIADNIIDFVLDDLWEVNVFTK